MDEPALLELPAGKLDVEGESRLDCAKRELGEEIGQGAAEWRELKRLYPSPGILEEEVTIFEATGLSEVDAEPDEDERLEVVASRSRRWIAPSRSAGTASRSWA